MNSGVSLSKGSAGQSSLTFSINSCHQKSRPEPTYPLATNTVAEEWSEPALQGLPRETMTDSQAVRSKPSVTGAAVPLRQVASVRLEASTPVIQHYGRQRPPGHQVVGTGGHSGQGQKIDGAGGAHPR